MAAILLQDVLPAARIQFCNYGLQQQGLEARPGMLFCDFSPHESRVEEFVKAGTLVLDHHKSARPVVEAFGQLGIFGDEVTNPGVSGAVLAYSHVWLPLKKDRTPAEKDCAEDLARLVGIRDTWQKRDPEWGVACEVGEALRFFSQESWMVPSPFAADRWQWWENRLTVGRRLVEKHTKTVEKALKGSWRFMSAGGNDVALFQGMRLVSDAQEMVDAAIVVAFDYLGIEQEGLVTLGYSLRSPAAGFNCAAFCKRQGGGGHFAAAGFTLRFDPLAGGQDPYSLFKARLHEYEAEAGLR
jgi:hypothetical protein